MPERIQRKRTPGWRLADATTNAAGVVIVDRTSRFGNPFTIAQAEELGYVDPRPAAVGFFTEWLSGNRDTWQSDEGDHKRERILADLHLLRGKDLACPCEEDQQCHADELLRRVNVPEQELAEWIAKVRARVDRNRTWRGESPMYVQEA